MTDNRLLGIILATLFTVANSGELCAGEWCDYGCCGSYVEKYCCEPSFTGGIIGIVTGSISLVAIITSGLVIKYCKCCCCKRKKGHTGHVYQTDSIAEGVPPNSYPLNTVSHDVHARYPVMGNCPPQAKLTMPTKNEPETYEPALNKAATRRTEPAYKPVNQTYGMAEGMPPNSYPLNTGLYDGHASHPVMGNYPPQAKVTVPKRNEPATYEPAWKKAATRRIEPPFKHLNQKDDLAEEGPQKSYLLNTVLYDGHASYPVMDTDPPQAQFNVPTRNEAATYDSAQNKAATRRTEPPFRHVNRRDSSAERLSQNSYSVNTVLYDGHGSHPVMVNYPPHAHLTVPTRNEPGTYDPEWNKAATRRTESPFKHVNQRDGMTERVPPNSNLLNTVLYDGHGSYSVMVNYPPQAQFSVPTGNEPATYDPKWNKDATRRTEPPFKHENQRDGMAEGLPPNSYPLNTVLYDGHESYSVMVNYPQQAKFTVSTRNELATYNPAWNKAATRRTEPPSY